ncbi:MAG TPA: hypothetical protein VMI92_08055 [Steroidobacteraceae bacterium]|nr:hypothetical protein [Steroidobacteraceae bacterium]
MMSWIATMALLLFLAGLAVLVRDLRQRNVSLWLGHYLRGDWRAPPVPAGTTRHLMFCFVDHYEPQFERPPYEIECQRVQRWREDYPKLCAGHRDADGRSPIHTFFYPQEEYRPEHISPLVELCRMGMGEMEVHLHHEDDTDAGLRAKLREFVGVLSERHDALPRDRASGELRWAFIHGNWALDNSHPDGIGCGINEELVILREEGCYADFTLPSAPSPCQTSTVNSIYYATDDPKPKSHDKGVRVRVGGQPSGDLMIVQGPLGLNWRSRRYGIIPRVENSDLRTSSPPTRARADSWVNTGIHVEGRPEWIFVKVHTHGAPERDVKVLLGQPMDELFSHLESRYNDGKDWKLHYVSARELYNIIKAAEQGFAGDPGQYRDHVLTRPGYQQR